MSQISILINTILASFLVTGSITWLYYSERLAYFPLGIFGVALATVVLPHLSNQHQLSNNNNQKSQIEFCKVLHWGIRWNLIVAIPATLTMLILAKPLIMTLFFYGKFTIHDVNMTKQSVLAYACGLPAFMLAKILSSACYACQEVKTPIKYSCIAIAVNIILSFLFIKPFAHTGLALATTCSSWLNVWMLLVYLNKKGFLYNSWIMSWYKFLKYLSIACLLPTIILLLANHYTASWANLTITYRFLATTGVLICAGMTYLPSLLLCGLMKRS